MKIVEDSYPTSAMQKQLLLYSLCEQETGIYIEQIVCSLHENLNISALIQSWQQVVARYSVLRTHFDWENPNQLMQSVDTQVNLPLEQQDWRKFSKLEQEDRLQDYLQRDRKQGFDISKAPLMRLALFQLAEADYKLVWTFHHALLDGRSFVILLKEVFTLYEAFCQNQNCQLLKPRPYKEYIDWLQQYSPANAEEFWRTLLRGFTTPIQLPEFSHHAPATTDSDYWEQSSGVQEVRLSVATTSTLQTLAKEQDVTLNTIIQGAWALLLNRYSNQDDVVFGTIRACRHSTLEGMESRVGLFINTVPVRVRVEPDLLLLPWLKELRSQWVAMRDYEHTSLTKIHEWSEVPRGTHLFDTLVMFEHREINAELRSQGGNWERREFQLLEQLDYPLVLYAYAGSEVLLKIQHDASRFDQGTIARMLGHLKTLLEGIATNPNRPLYDLPLLTEAERHQLLVEWNNTQAVYPQDKCLHQLFEAQVERTPDAVAVVFKDSQLTYRELNTRANKVAHHLQALGVGAEVLVGICVERSLEMVIGVLGILKAGGAYVPLDPKYPKERLADLLSDSRVSVLLTQHRLIPQLPEHTASVVCLDTDWATICAEREENPESSVGPENLAYIIYTSGSTGKPKGVVIEHRGAVNTIVDINQRFSVGIGDRILAVSSLNFDLSVYDIFGLLAAGGAIVIPEASIAPNPAHWLELMVNEKITLWNSAPPVMQLFMGYVAQHVESSLPSLRLVLLSGDWIPLTLPDHIQSLGKNIQVISLGGATEASIWSIYYPIETVDSTWKSIPYGKPLSNQQFYILDSHLHPVPIGVAGELYIGGDGVARSYLNRPDLTQERFIPNPFSDKLGDRIYKTGDLGRYLPDGNIEFLGRLDHQVKIRGYRIELGEIEAVLTQHPQIREALVIAREDRPGDKYLAAYVIPEKQQVSGSNELRDFLKQRLPDYMVPAIVFLESLPLTPNGKIDRRALPAPEQSTPESPTTFVAPRNELELQLAKLWESVLNIHPIGVRDNFFELGGHSLLATRLWMEIEKLAGKNLPLATLFQAPTIEQLANILSQEGWSLSCSSLMVIQPGGSKPPLFCIHVLGRGLEFFRPLVRYLDPEQPVYGLSTHVANVDEKQAPPNRVEDLAAFYVKEMQSLQPEGPYFLTGVSFGGEVAFEMARLLVAQGEKVALLALLDSVNQYAFQPVPKREQLAAHWSNLLQFGPAYIKKIVLGHIEEFNHRLDLRIQGISCKLYQVIGRPLPDALQDYTYEMLNEKAAWDYTPQVYPGLVTLFRASDRAASTSVSTRFDPELGWGKLAAGGLEIHDVSGDHLGILEEPHVRGLGEKLRACIDKALAAL